MKLKTSSKVSLLRILLIFALAVTIISLFMDLTTALMYWNGDLRNRVVGARVLLEGGDPYFFKWNPSLSDKLLDPAVPIKSVVTRLTVPPTVLILHSMIAGLSYFQQKVIWLIVQWTALFSTIFIFMKMSNSPIKRNLILLLGWFIFNSHFWRIHIDGGQIYILYTALLSLAWFIAQKSFKFSEIVSGFLVGLTASLRPPIILLFIPFFIYRKWNLLLGSIVGLISSLLLSLMIAGTSVWKSYLFSMTGMTKLLNWNHPVLSSVPKNPVEATIAYPKIIEGISTANMTSTNSWRILTDSSIQKSLSRFFGINIPGSVLVIGLLITILLISVFYFRFSRKKSNSIVFLSGITLYLTSEFFLPIARYNYNDVQWLLPLSIILIELDIFELLSNKFIGLLLAGLLLCLGCFSWIPNYLVFSIFMLAIYTITMTLTIIKNRDKLLNIVH